MAAAKVMVCIEKKTCEDDLPDGRLDNKEGSAIMKRYYGLVTAILVMPLMVCSCSWLKQTSKTTDTAQEDLTVKSDITTTAEKELTTKALQLNTNTGANGAVYALRLWPKGKFTFSAEKGFEGDADSIILEGKEWGFENHSELRDTEVLEKVNVEQAAKQDAKMETNQKKIENKSFADYKLVIGALILIAFGVFWLFKRKVFS